MELADYHCGFESQIEELANIKLDIKGKLPDWLDGSLIRTQPALFEIGKDQVAHWFDGFAKLVKFSLNREEITFSTRFLQTDAYIKSLRQQKIAYSGFATAATTSSFERLVSLFDNQITDNDNVNVALFNEQMIAMTETSSFRAFDPANLNTLDRIIFDDKLNLTATTAHPHSASGLLFNLGIEFSASSHYLPYFQTPGSKKRQLLAKIAVKEPSYIHAFAISESYFVLIDYPLRVNPLEIALSGKPYIKNFRWQEKSSTKIYICDLKGLDKPKVFETEPFFAFHPINAYQSDNALIIDLPAYKDSSIIDELSLASLRSSKAPQLPRGLRLTLDLQKGCCSEEPLWDTYFELPRINYKAHNGKPYKFAYAATSQDKCGFFDSVLKIDLERGETLAWNEEHCYPGEPVFIPSPNAKAEDDGVIAATVLDSRKRQSYLVILDAKTMNEIARAVAPHVIPFGFHTQFFTGVH